MIPSWLFPLFLLTASTGLQATDKFSYAGDVTDVRVVRSIKQEPQAGLLGIPRIVQWKPRHLVVAYEVGIPGKTDMGSIDVVVSRDDGKVWSIPATVFDHRQRHGNLQFG